MTWDASSRCTFPLLPSFFFPLFLSSPFWIDRRICSASVSYSIGASNRTIIRHHPIQTDSRALSHQLNTMSCVERDRLRLEPFLESASHGLTPLGNECGGESGQRALDPESFLTEPNQHRALLPFPSPSFTQDHPHLLARSPASAPRESMALLYSKRAS